MRKAKVTITFCSIVLAGLAFAANARAECSRETLQKLADTYVKAQTAGKATMVPLAAKGASYAENDKAMDIAKGVLAGPLKVDFTRSFYDTTQCATFTEVVAATDPHPYVIHTRMEATKDGEGVEDGVGGDGRGGLGVRRDRAPCRHADREVGRDPQGQARHARGHPGGGRRVPEQLGGSDAPGAAWHALLPARRPHEHGHPEPGGPIRAPWGRSRRSST